MKTLRWIGGTLLVIILVFFLPLGVQVGLYYTGEGDWRADRTQRHGTTNQAPTADSNESVIQVYAARAARWRGAFGVHTWFAIKRSDERRYTRMEVIGYNVYWGGAAIRMRTGSPDSRWYGSDPVLLREIRGGPRVDVLIDRIRTAVGNYPYDHTYHVWPGPNSNTFIAWLARAVPELRLELPATAIGKDYLPGGAIAAATPSGTGFQLSIRGLAGVLAGLEEGIEFNFLGLTAGIDLFPPAIKLPGVGRIGFPDIRREELH